MKPLRLAPCLLLLTGCGLVPQIVVTAAKHLAVVAVRPVVGAIFSHGDEPSDGVVKPETDG